MAEAGQKRRALTAPAMGRGSWAWRYGFPVAVVLLVGLMIGSAAYGRNAFLDSSEGRTIELVTDPLAPGYQVLTEPTPTALIVQTDDAGDLVGLTFMALSSDQTGSALFIPPTTVIDMPGAGLVPIRDTWTTGGLESVVDGVEALLGVGIAEFADDGTLLGGDVFEVNRDRWAELTAPTAPFTIENLDAIEVTDDAGEVVARFPDGEFDLESAAVGAWLEARNENESDLNRLARHQTFWEAWIEAIRASDDPGAVPGETATGIGMFVRGFADGEVGFVIIPASSYRIPGTSEDVYLAEVDEVQALVTAMVPFPAAAVVGSRPTLRVLDGTGTPGSANTVARMLAEAGAEIRAVGNGPNFDQVGTQIIYYDRSQLDAAELIAEALGVGTVEFRENPEEVVAVTVIFGTDVTDSLDQ